MLPNMTLMSTRASWPVSAVDNSFEKSRQKQCVGFLDIGSSNLRPLMDPLRDIAVRMEQNASVLFLFLLEGII